MRHASEETTAIILAGGLGSRLQSVRADLPKPMIPCAGQPFLNWVLKFLHRQRVERCVVSACHLANVVQEFVKNRQVDGQVVECVVEPRPLGTGGAIRFAWSEMPERPVCVVNGDSLLLADWSPAWERFNQPNVEGVLIGRHVDDASRYGSLQVDDAGRLLAFREKVPGAGLINAGIYFLKPSLMAGFPAEAPSSVERDVFPKLLERGHVLHVVPLAGPFLDIGLPESLAQADEFLPQNWPQD